MYVLDATPLIYLAKADRLAFLEKLDRPRVTTRSVYEEVVTRGVEAGYPDARRVERSVERGSIEVLSVEESPTFAALRRNEHLSEADASVLALADERDAVAVVDERYGRAVADVEGIETRGTAYLLLRLLRDGRIPKADARETIDDIVDAGWYCSPDLYAKLVRKIDEVG